MSDDDLTAAASGCVIVDTHYYLDEGANIGIHKRGIYTKEKVYKSLT